MCENQASSRLTYNLFFFSVFILKFMILPKDNSYEQLAMTKMQLNLLHYFDSFGQLQSTTESSNVTSI